MKPIYIVDIIIVSLLLYLIVLSVMTSKHYMDESMDKGLLEKLQYMLHPLIEPLKSMILILSSGVHLSQDTRVRPGRAPLKVYKAI